MVLASELGEYAVSLRYSDLSEHAVHTAKQRLIDSLGCGWAPSPPCPPGTGGVCPGLPRRGVRHPGRQGKSGRLRPL